MNLKLMGIGAVVIAIIAVAGFATYYAIENEWFTPWGGGSNAVDGTWKDEVIITYADGSTGSLKAVIDSPWPLSIEYDGKEITEITYQLSGESTGEGYDVCHIDFTNFQIDAMVISDAFNNPYDIAWTTPSMDLLVNGGSEVILSIPLDLEDILSGSPSVTYNIGFVPYGTIQFRGEGDDIGEWFSATLPDGRYLWVDKIAGTITLDFASTVAGN